MKIFLKILILLFVIIYSNLLFSAQKDLIVGVYSDKPLIFKNANGKADGLWIDLLQYILKGKFHLKYYYGEWTEIYSLLKKGKIDILPDIAITRQRERFFDFNKINVLTCWGEIIVSSNSKINSIFDLKNKKVACVPDDIHCIKFKKLMKKFHINFKFIPVKKYIDVFKLIMKNKIDAGAVNNIFFLNNSKGFNVKETSIIYNPIDLRFAVTKGDPKDILPVIDNELKKLKEDKNSYYYQALNKWIKQTPTYYTFNVKLLITFIIIIFTLLCIILIFRLIIKKKTEELVNTNKTLNTLLNGIIDAIFLHDEKGNIIDVNDGMLKMYKISKEEALNLTIFDFSGEPKDFKKAYELWKKVLNNESIPPLEWKAKRPKTGEIFPVEVLLRKINVKNRDLILASVRDITLKKEYERKLIEEKEKLEITLGNINDGVITTDRNGIITYANKVAQKLIDVSLNKIVGEKADEILILYDEKEKEYISNPVENTIKNKHSVNYYNCKLISKTQKEFIVNFSSNPVKNFDGKIIGIVVTIRDISNEIKMHEEMIKIKKLESISFLAGGIAHDFNNFLAGIVGNISLIKVLLKEKNIEKIENILEKIENVAIKAKGLTTQLLTFAKGGEPIIKAESIIDVITQVTDFILTGSKVKPIIKFEKNLKNVLMDKDQISQVFQNLIINAKEAMPKGGIISINCSNIEINDSLLPLQKGEYVKIEIKDNGNGIPEKHLDKIFEPFFTTKSDGSGLGLSICHSIIQKHNGNINVESELGKGTKFTIYLPATDKNEEDFKIEKNGYHINQNLSNILIIDDEEFIREFFSDILELKGFKVFTAENSKKAIKIFKENHIDLCFIDLTLPGDIGGLEIFNKLKEINPQIKAIVMSGYSNDPIISNYKNYGFIGYLTKPFKIEDILKVLNQ